MFFFVSQNRTESRDREREKRRGAQPIHTIDMKSDERRRLRIQHSGGEWETKKTTAKKRNIKTKTSQECEENKKRKKNFSVRHRFLQFQKYCIVVCYLK